MIVLVAREISVHLDFQVELPLTRFADVNGRDSDTINAILESVINRSQVIVEPNLVSRSADSRKAAALPTAIIETDGTAGMVQVSHLALESAGITLADVDSRNFHLYQGERELAWRMIGIGTDESRMEAGESLVFYASGEHSRWTTSEIFKLVVEETPGRLMENGNVPPAGLPAGGLNTQLRMMNSPRHVLP